MGDSPRRHGDTETRSSVTEFSRRWFIASTILNTETTGTTEPETAKGYCPETASGYCPETAGVLTKSNAGFFSVSSSCSRGLVHTREREHGGDTEDEPGCPGGGRYGSEVLIAMSCSDPKAVSAPVAATATTHECVSDTGRRGEDLREVPLRVLRVSVVKTAFSRLANARRSKRKAATIQALGLWTGLPASRRRTVARETGSSFREC